MRKPIEINSGSMADIAFLLLIFFLVATTIDQDKGIRRKLPPDMESVDVNIHKRNVLAIMVNKNDDLQVNGMSLEITELRSICKGFVDNHGLRSDWSVSPQKAIVSIKSSIGSSYKAYVGIQNEVAAAFRELRDLESQKRYGKDFHQLEYDTEVKSIKIAYPMRVSEAEPDENG